jgi:hypothetical protein
VKDRFERTHFSRENRYWLGIDIEADGHFLEIPVSNMMVDYVETYAIAAEQYQLFVSDEAAATKFADECRRREHDDLLVFQPGTDRGLPR